MLRSVPASARDLVLRFFATDAEAEINTESDSFDERIAYLVGQAGILASAVWRDLPHDHPAALYANTVIGWAGMKLLKPDYWRFGRGLVSYALDVGGVALTDSQRGTLETVLSFDEDHIDGPGDRLGNVDQVLGYTCRRLNIVRDDGDPPEDWPLLALTYSVGNPIQNESSALEIAARALAEMPSLPYGKLFVSSEGRLLYQLGCLEDPSRELDADALRRMAWVAVREGIVFEARFGAATAR